MRRFILEVLAFGLCQVLILAVAWRTCPRDPDHYAAAAIDKRRRITTTTGPRMIVVGGSSVSFGVDSRVIEARGLTPVNMGHNVGLGLAFMLAQTGDHLQAGDVVVVAPEYPLLWRGPSDASLVTLVEHDPRSAGYLNATTCGRMLDGGLRWMGGKLRCALHQVTTDPEIFYSRRAFDGRGDFVLHRGRPATGDPPLPVGWPSSLGPGFDAAVAQLDAFGERCERVGARCVLAMPPLRAAQYAAGQAVIDAVQQRLEAEQRMPIVLVAAEAVAPDDQFFDAGPHLTEPAARQRTKRILDALGVGPPSDS